MYNAEKNNLLHVLVTSLALGAVIGAAVAYRTPLCVYYGIVAVFHVSEFVSVAKYSARTVTHDSFLVWNNKGSEEYWLMQALGVAEYALRRYTSVGSVYGSVLGGLGYLQPFLKAVSVLVSVSGIGIRHLAIKKLGRSFSHYIEADKQGQVLVSTGIFAYERHPSYLGFYLYCVGLQVYLGNVVTTVAVFAVMRVFFGRRVTYEETQMERSYGDEWRRYKNRVPSLVGR